MLLPKVVAEFPDEVNSAHMGVPVHQVKEFAPQWSFWMLHFLPNSPGKCNV